jgi:hypothetical protein
MSVTVLVKFANGSYYYKTRVSNAAGDDAIHAYFVGQMFDVGEYPVENLQRCTGIEIIRC